MKFGSFKSRPLQALSSALFLGLAGFGLATTGGTVLVSTAHAATVRPEVGKPLQEAQDLAAKGKYKEALAKVKQAESVSKLTADENKVIDQMRSYISSRSGNASAYEQMIAKGQGSATVARNLIRAHYMAKQYSKVIADEAILRKYGALDASSITLIAQAQYLTGNYRDAIKTLKGRDDVNSLKMIYGAAFKANDRDAMTTALQKLILATGDAQYWKAAIDLGSRPPLSDHQTLYMLRLRLFTGNMRTGSSGDDDYSLLSQIAIQLGLPGEAQAVLDKGVKAGVVSGARAQRLINMARTQAKAMAAKLDADAAKARKAPKGDTLVNLGETYWGYGRYQEAADAVKDGIKIGVENHADAQMALGLAELSLGHRDAAARAFKAVTEAKDGKKPAEIAGWYEVLARTNTNIVQADNSKTKSQH
ncbi:MAG: hypothetical protein J0H79_00750 [Alphaproteobacteria bacterium]|nr:hypothetical protein [Alphaproteobacteria bacterium]OJU58246.1 MAG: hypothetical protein BGO00_05560 [Alphaproteobacteria bacterium 62-8]